MLKKEKEKEAQNQETSKNQREMYMSTEVPGRAAGLREAAQSE